MDLTEAENIKKRWQEYTEELCKKDLHAPDNHDGVITDLEPDILECEVKWALESITRKWQPTPMFLPGESHGWRRLVGCSPWGCTESDTTEATQQQQQQHNREKKGKSQFSFQSQRKAMPKNAQTTAQLHSSHMLVKECSKFSKPGFSNT